MTSGGDTLYNLGQTFWYMSTWRYSTLHVRTDFWCMLNRDDPLYILGQTFDI